MSVSPNHRSFELVEPFDSRDDVDVLIERFEIAVSAKTATNDAFQAAQVMFREIIDRCGGDPARRAALKAARVSFQAMRGRYMEAVAAERAGNRAVKLRIVAAIEAAAKVPNPLVFHEHVSGCRLLWRQTGPVGPDGAVLVEAYRAADRAYRAACKASVAATIKR